jgi:hypothetical protein
MAQDNGYISYVNKVTDLFQIPLSYVYQPNNKTVALLLHVPLVKQEYLLNMNQYLPFPLTHNLSPNHSLMPSVGQNNILTYSGFDTFKILSQSDLASCHKMGDTHFCKGRNNLRTDMTETCLGSLYLQQGKGIQKYCKFEISAVKEQFFRFAHNNWAIATQKQFTTHQVCGKDRKPVTVVQGTTITLEPGCKIRLQLHILTADTFEEEIVETTHFCGLGTPHKSFPTSSLSNFQKQFNCSTIMAFTFLMLPILPTILNLRISMTQFQLQSLISLQIRCTVSPLYFLDYSFCICVISCIHCIAKRFMTNFNLPFPQALLRTFLRYLLHLPHMCTTNQTAWV